MSRMCSGRLFRLRGGRLFRLRGGGKGPPGSLHPRPLRQAVSELDEEQGRQGRRPLEPQLDIWAAVHVVAHASGLSRLQSG
ncbi:MAG: hypothetical protein MUD01_04060 [Chloroflexaceae bacterium]|nr:hypothetical protein [Chloroflexaceae bacterium]